jgi:hypothetical protein
MKPLTNIAPVVVALLLASPCMAGDNTAGGTAAGAAITSGTDNTILGTQAGESISSGGYNVIIGEDGNITTGGSNILIGNSLSRTVAGTSTQIDIGDTIYGSLEATSGGTALNIGTVSDTGVTLSVLGEGSMLVPSGTTAERPSSTTNGQLRYNRTLDSLEGYANGSWENIPSTSSSSGQVFSSGRLEYDTDTEIKYCPYKGNLKTTAAYGTYTIPSGCIFGDLKNGMYIAGLTPTVAAANTLYYVYLINVAGTTYLDLEIPTNAIHEPDPTTGVEVQWTDPGSGPVANPDLTLVGMIYTDANAEIAQGASGNTVATWDNRQPTYCSARLSTTIGYSSSTFAELQSGNRCSFMTWLVWTAGTVSGDEVLFTADLVSYNSNSGAATMSEAFFTDPYGGPTSWLVTQGQTQTFGTTNNYNLALPAAAWGPSEGCFYVSVKGAAASGTTGYWKGGEQVRSIQ